MKETGYVMEIKCPVCGKSYNLSALQDLLPDDCDDYHKAVSLFRNKGCEAFGQPHNLVRKNNDK